MNSSMVWSRRGKLLLIPAGVLAFIFILSVMQPTRDSLGHGSVPLYSRQVSYRQYNTQSTSYKIAIISDMDTASKVGDKLQWKGIMKQGTLERSATGKYSIKFAEDVR